jgi:uncharacterized protein YacL
MLTEKEIAFIQFWEANREQQKTDIKPLIKGLSVGLMISLAIFIFTFSGWYERATMQANARLSPFVFMVIILLLCFFMGILYRSRRWEVLEQQYLELVAKRKKEQQATQHN